MSDMPITRIEAFFRGVHRRIPGGNSDAAVAARESIAKKLATLNAAMLERDVDHRVPVDIEEMAAQIADRMGRWTSADWSRNAMVSRASDAVQSIAADLRGGGASTVDDADADDEWTDD